jgi:hypothetical protein
MNTPRRRFLGWLGKGSLLGVAGVPALPGIATGQEGGALTPVSDEFDVSWVERVSGRHRAVFDSPEVSDGAALFRAVAWCQMYKDVYGTARTDMSPVLVLRHSAIPLIMSNAYWEHLEVGKALKMRNAKGEKWAKANPLSRGDKAKDAQGTEYTLESFIESGGVVLACNWAFGGRIVADLVARDKLERAAARTRALELMIPGVILQPNGIFAALRAQEAGCHYVLAS